MGNHTLVVFAHADNVHPPRVAVHKRERTDLADALVAAFVVGRDVQLQALDLRAELLGIYRIVARPAQIPVGTGPLPFRIDHPAFAHAGLQRLSHLLVVIGIAVLVQFLDAPLDVTDCGSSYSCGLICSVINVNIL
jgi:hypothetical protein